MMQRVAEINSLAVSVQFSMVLRRCLLPLSIFSGGQPVTILLGHDQARLRTCLKTSEGTPEGICGASLYV